MLNVVSVIYRCWPALILVAAKTAPKSMAATTICNWTTTEWNWPVLVVIRVVNLCLPTITKKTTITKATTKIIIMQTIMQVVSKYKAKERASRMEHCSYHHSVLFDLIPILLSSIESHLSNKPKQCILKKSNSWNLVVSQY